jgi:hypothetical protein
MRMSENWFLLHTEMVFAIGRTDCKMYISGKHTAILENSRARRSRKRL